MRYMETETEQCLLATSTLTNAEQEMQYGPEEKQVWNDDLVCGQGQVIGWSWL